VRYHFITDQGTENLTQAEADELVKLDTDYHTRDLFEAIARGEYPSWTLKMQIMPFEDAKTYRFNPFDLTKVWPHGDYPLIEVGRLTLDRNPTDHHRARGNRATWCPASARAQTKCCWAACSPMATPTATASARTKCHLDAGSRRALGHSGGSNLRPS
jgi:Catalase